MRTSRAFTLVELLVVIATIAMLVALLLPAVQAAREASRRTTCVNRFRQVALGVQNYASANNDRLPVGRSTPISTFFEHGWAHRVGWRYSVLPFLEEGVLSDLVNFDESPESTANKAFYSAAVPVFQCPSTPGYPRLLVDSDRDLSVGARDQEAVSSIEVHGYGTNSDTNDLIQLDDKNLTIELYRGGWFNGSNRDLWLGFGRSNSGSGSWSHAQARLAAIEDGLSKTLMLVEQAGLPQEYERGRSVEVESPPKSPTRFGWYAGSAVHLKIYHDRDAVNFRNDRNSIYGFHDGAVAANFDGSVTTLAVDIDKRVLINKLARNDGR